MHSISFSAIAKQKEQNKKEEKAKDAIIVKLMQYKDIG